jgi:hypothetical protein
MLGLSRKGLYLKRQRFGHRAASKHGRQRLIALKGRARDLFVPSIFSPAAVPLLIKGQPWAYFSTLSQNHGRCPQTRRVTAKHSRSRVSTRSP